MKKLYFLLLVVGCSANAQNINFTDAVFKAKLLDSETDQTIAFSGNEAINIDANGDNQISQAEALAVTELGLSGYGITNVSGIEKFTNLERIFLSQNQIASMNLTGLVNLKLLYCSGNTMQTLVLGSMPNLKDLDCAGNELSSIDLSLLPMLDFANMGGNYITGLNLAGNPLLTKLYAEMNHLTSIDLSGNLLLKEVSLDGNQLSTLDVTPHTQLTRLFCSNNLLTVLSLGIKNSMQYLKCFNNQLISLDLSGVKQPLPPPPVQVNRELQGNQLVYLNLKNGSADGAINFSNNPDLKFICVDDSELAAITTKLQAYQYTGTNLNSYCTFEPGGITYTLNGSLKLDTNANGCDAADSLLKGLNLGITNGTQSGSIISNTGNYSIAVSAGTHTVTPVLENPSYFNISPASVSITFPTQTSPQTQNFCITPNGTHNDLEVSLIATVPARPGFDAAYRLVYKNKGNTVQSGSVAMTFNDALTDFVSATVAPIQGSNTLTWNYVALQPFETRTIDVTLNINTPMETPSVNGGDVLDYHAFILGNGSEETPADNEALLMQTVVNSFDPNDKTCSEGATITPSMVGKYVHYTIRFENTGTFAAQNIVVKDMIDTAKFDVASLVALHGSHPFETRISNTNKVEFIFENINLPFDDANNDGYITFKIKTKPTLVLGDTFSNTASIYFDYNFPIVTDPAVTTVQVLGNEDFEWNKLFSVYPNPAGSFLNLDNKTGAVLKSISIYNMLGQLVMVVPNAKDIDTVDVSGLSAGNYIIKVASNKGGSSIPFIKK